MSDIQDIVNGSVVLNWINGVDDGVERNSSSFPEPGTKWNLINAKWLKNWRITLEPGYSYETAVELPGVIDNSLLVHEADDIWRQENEKTLKKNLVLHEDFEIIPVKAWAFLAKTFKTTENSEISKVSVRGNGPETSVEIYQKPLKLLCFKEKLLFFHPVTFFVSYKDTIRNLYIKVRKLLRIHLKQNLLESELRLWLVDPSLSLPVLEKTLENSLAFPGKHLENNLQPIENCEIADDDLICTELKNVTWAFPVPDSISDPIPLASSKPFNCTASVRKNGLVGLQNLGNTCYMNSGLQCLSNTYPLTKYFLSENYRKDVNYQNKLGTQGKLVEEYAKLVKEMWHGSAPFVSPFALKKELSAVARQFAGTLQHDSQEMLSFLIDGLHEDVNRIEKRPGPNETAVEGLSESQTADFFWSEHLKRNSSVIVDLMYGQFKSTIICPEGHKSLTFDPFLMLSVPMPKIDKRLYKIKFVRLECLPIFDCAIIADIGCTAFIVKQHLSNIFQIDADEIGIATCTGNFIAIGLKSDKDIVDSASDIIAYELPKSKFAFVQYRRRKDFASVCSGPSISYTRLYAFTSESTFQDLHITIYSFLQRLCKSIKLLPLDEIIENQGTDITAAYTLNFVRKNSENGLCQYCSQACNNCTVPYNDSFISEYIGKNEDFNSLEILWGRFIPIDAVNEMTKITPHESVEIAYKNLQIIRNAPMDLYQCIEEFSKSENLDHQNRTFCTKCKTLAKGVKKMEIWRLPQVLIFHLKRFRQVQGNKIKDKREILFDVQGLDLTQIAEVNGGVYDLYAVSNHYGDMNYGHYTAYAMNYKKKTWFEFDDSRVIPMEEDRVVSSDAYLLFYKRRGNNTID